MKALSLKAQLLLLSIFFLTVTVVVGVAAYMSNKGISSEYEHLISKTLPKEKHLNSFYEHFLKIRMNLRNLGLPGIKKEDAETSQRVVLEGLKAVENDRRSYEALGFTPGQKEIYEEQIKAWKDFVAVGGEVLRHYKAGTPEDMKEIVNIFFTTCPQTADRFAAATADLRKFHENEIKERTLSAEKIADDSLMINILTVGVGVLIALTLGYFFASSLSKKLMGISESIFKSAEQTSSGADQLSGASGQLSQASTRAAASLEETVASLEELSSMVKLNSRNAQQANTLSQKSREAAEKGEREISTLISSMSDLATGSKKIEEILSVIDDIAFQTNLLALNAAVEAARAGEQGKGFAVVADAVRTLAQRSASAAKDISSLIKENVDKSKNGARIAGASGEALKEILVAVKKVAELNSEIATGSEEQTQGLEQISKAMNQLDQGTQNNAAASEEVAASSQRMAQQGHSLSDLVKSLQEIVHGRSEYAEGVLILSANQSRASFHEDREVNFGKSKAGKASGF